MVSSHSVNYAIKFPSKTPRVYLHNFYFIFHFPFKLILCKDKALKFSFYLIKIDYTFPKKIALIIEFEKSVLNEKSVESFLFKLSRFFVKISKDFRRRRNFDFPRKNKTKKKLICSQFHFVKFFILEITLKIISAQHRSVEIRFFRYFFHIFMNKRRQELRKLKCFNQR